MDLQTKTVFLFDPETLAYTMPEVCWHSPRNPGSFFEPRNCLETAPNIVTGTWPVADLTNKVWVNQLDYRGQVWYDQTTGAETEITTVGTPASNLVETIPQSILDAKAAALAALPNPSGFVAVLKTDWGIVECNTLAASYPLFFAAISESDWPSVQALAIDAQAKNVLSTTQYASIKSAAIANNIPITL